MADAIPMVYELIPFYSLNRNPLAEAAAHFGFPVLYYEGIKPNMSYFIASVMDVLAVSIAMHICISILYRGIICNLNTWRRPVAIIISAIILVVPTYYTSDLHTVCFMFLAESFRVSLNFYDVAVLRGDEIRQLSNAEFFAYLWLLPLPREQIAEREKIEGKKRDPRLQCLRLLPHAMIQGFISCIILMFMPPKDLYEPMSLIHKTLYSSIASLAIFNIIAGIVTIPIYVAGIVLGVEMAPTFQNPFTAVGLRTFWSRWNRLIATVLHRVVFGGKGTNKTVDVRKKEQAKHKAEGRPAPNVAVMSAKAMLTFIVSGIFHEYMLRYSAKEPILGPNTLFFIVNGVATIASTMLATAFPKLNKQTPNIVKQVAMYTFGVLVTPLFCTPYYHSGYFTEGQSIFNQIFFSRKTPATIVFIRIF